MKKMLRPYRCSRLCSGAASSATTAPFTLAIEPRCSRSKASLPVGIWMLFRTLQNGWSCP